MVATRTKTSELRTNVEGGVSSCSAARCSTRCRMGGGTGFSARPTASSNS